LLPLTTVSFAASWLEGAAGIDRALPAGQGKIASA